MKPPIYVPSGKAREYSPLALNLYLQCGHGCKYCYVPTHIRKKSEDFFVENANPRNINDMLRGLEKQLNDLDKLGPSITDQVLLSFTCDPYTPSADGNRITREVLKVLQRYDVPTAVLTKNPLKCFDADYDIIKKFKLFSIGTTMTCATDEACAEWEPNAPQTWARFQGLAKFHNERVRTFVSLEPVISGYDSLIILRNLVEMRLGDVIKLGKMNGYWESKLPKIHYSSYLREALDMLRPHNIGVYVKKDLRDACPDVELTDREKDMDYYSLKKR